MIKKIAWEAFKNTGDINTYLEFKQIEEIEKGIWGRSFNPFEQGLRDIPNKLDNSFNIEKRITKKDDN